MWARLGHLDGSCGTLNIEGEVKRYSVSWKLSMRQGHDGLVLWKGLNCVHSHQMILLPAYFISLVLGLPDDLIASFQ